MSDENPALPWQIKRLGLQTTLADRLRDEGIHSVRELVARSPAELLGIRWIGPTYVAQVSEALAEIGLALRSNGADESEAAPKLSTTERLIGIDAKLDWIAEAVRQISLSIPRNSTP